jgi:hypothetical protein
MIVQPQTAGHKKIRNKNRHGTVPSLTVDGVAASLLVRPRGTSPVGAVRQRARGDSLRASRW